MKKLSDNDIQSILVSAQKLVADRANAPDHKSEKGFLENSEEPVFDLYNSGPLFTNLNQIGTEEVYRNFEKVVQELIREDNEEESFKLTILLEDVLNQQSIQLKSISPGLLTGYQKLLNLAKYIAITTLNLNEIEPLIKNCTVLAFQRGIDVQDKLDAALVHYNDSLREGAISELFYNALSNSLEIVGFGEIKFLDGAKEQSPTLKNWFVDYITFNRLKNSGRRTAFQRINYIEKSPNALKLSQDERNLLFKIFEILDWLEFGDLELINLLTEAYGNDDVLDTSQAKLDESTEAVGSKVIDRPKVLVAPQVPTAPNVKLQKPMEEVQKVGIKNYKLPARQQAEPQAMAGGRIKENPTTPPPSLRPQGGGIKDRKMDLDDMDARPGLKMWNSAPPQMPKQSATNNRVVEISAAEVVVEDSTAGTSAKIDKKLEELEDRVKSKK